MALALRLGAYELLRSDGSRSGAAARRCLRRARYRAQARTGQRWPAKPKQVLVDRGGRASDIPPDWDAVDRVEIRHARGRPGGRISVSAAMTNDPAESDDRAQRSRPTNSRRIARHGPGAPDSRGGSRRRAQPGQGCRPWSRVPGASGVGRQRGRRRAWSGPGPDVRDPQTFGAATMDLARSPRLVLAGRRGFGVRVSGATVVGDQIADHADPTGLRRGRADRVGASRRRGPPSCGWCRPSCWPRSRRARR